MPTDLLVRATNLIPPVRRSREIRLHIESEFPETALSGASPTHLTRWQWMATGYLALAVWLAAIFLVPIDNQYPIYMYFAIVGTILAVHDFITLRLPDWLTLTSYPAVLLMLLFNVFHFHYYEQNLTRAVEACGVMLALFGVLCLLTSTGYGDLKLAGFIGLALGTHGWLALYQGSVYGWFLAAMFVALRAAVGRGGRPVPLGTFLFAGAFVALAA